MEIVQVASYVIMNKIENLDWRVENSEEMVEITIVSISKEAFSLGEDGDNEHNSGT